MESHLPAVRSVGNLPMQISEKRHLFIQVGDVSIVRDIRTFSKYDGQLKTDALHIVRLQAAACTCLQLLIGKPKFTFSRMFQRVSKNRFRFGNLRESSRAYVEPQDLAFESAQKQVAETASGY